MQERLLAWLSGGFGVMGLILACVGLTGTMAYAISRRTSEIGIHMALGASRGRVVWTFLREALVLSLAGSLIGVALAAALSRWATAVLFAIKPTDPLTIAAAAVLLTLTVIGAAIGPSWRASWVNPVDVLRRE